MLKINSYKTILTSGEAIYTTSGSKFIAYAFPITSLEDFKMHKDLLKKMHPNANHIVYAYRFGFGGESEKYSDDGEPSGSAGRPVLNTLKSNSLTYLSLFVIRYFGGKKLGLSGLIHAYQTATAQVISKMHIEVIDIKDYYKVVCHEKDINNIIHIFHTSKVHIDNISYGIMCNFIISFSRADAEKNLQKITSLWQITTEYLFSK